MCFCITSAAASSSSVAAAGASSSPGNVITSSEPACGSGGGSGGGAPLEPAAAACSSSCCTRHRSRSHSSSLARSCSASSASAPSLLDGSGTAAGMKRYWRCSCARNCASSACTPTRTSCVTPWMSRRCSARSSRIARNSSDECAPARGSCVCGWWLWPPSYALGLATNVAMDTLVPTWSDPSDVPHAGGSAPGTGGSRTPVPPPSVRELTAACTTRPAAPRLALERPPGADLSGSGFRSLLKTFWLPCFRLRSAEGFQTDMGNGA
eukprot:2215289-Prymnesium_polylepis.1